MSVCALSFGRTSVAHGNKREVSGRTNLEGMAVDGKGRAEVSVLAQTMTQIDEGWFTVVGEERGQSGKGSSERDKRVCVCVGLGVEGCRGRREWRGWRCAVYFGGATARQLN